MAISSCGKKKVLWQKLRQLASTGQNKIEVNTFMFCQIF